MAHTTTSYIDKWYTFHENGPYPAKILFDTSLERKEIIPLSLDRYNDAAQEIQRLLQDSLDNNERFRALGSKWSLSNIAHQKDRMQTNSNLNISSIQIEASDMHHLSGFIPENLFFFQCGITIKEISQFLKAKGKSLKTQGASNGQTIAGALSTGVHGSAFDVGSVQDYVVGINLIIGPNPEDIVYLESNKQPALSDAFAQKINARVIRNEGLFNAALVGLGSFGFIHGVVIEAENLFLLKRYVRKVPQADAIELAETMDFANANFKIATEVDTQGKGLRPYHYKIFINPYRQNDDYIIELMYKKPYRVGYPDPIPDVKKALYTCLPTFMAKLAARFNKLIPLFINSLNNEVFPSEDTVIEGTLGEIFWDTTHKGPAFACSMGIDHQDSGKVLELLVKLAKDVGPVPGAYAMRFVKASKATLAFTKFPITCMIEMDGILWEENQNIISLESFCRKIIEVLKANHIQFTLHWGKNADWSFPGLLDYMYGNKDDEWKDYRSALLSREMADLFSNDFLDTLKLSDYRVNASNNLVASNPVV